LSLSRQSSIFSCFLGLEVKNTIYMGVLQWLWIFMGVY
jgi:hypothetical protein